MQRDAPKSPSALRLRPLGLAVVLTLLVVGVSQAAPPGAGVSDFRAKMEKWVETRQLISKERSDWAEDREMLRSTRDLLKREKEALEAEVAEFEETATVADEERRQLLLQRGENQRASLALEEEIRHMEEQVLALAPRLPEPLQAKLEPLLVQIPEDPEKTSQRLGQRLMNVLGILLQAEKFNTTATFVGETRATDGEQQVQVRTLYWGLGQAIYVDAQGRSAGVGRPGPDGWEFTNDPDLAGDAQLLLDIYEGNVDTIEFVDLPVQIQ